MFKKLKNTLMSEIDAEETKITRFPGLNAVIRLVIEFLSDMTKDNVGLYAAQSTFFTILSAVPFLMLVIFCLKYFIKVDVTALTAPIHRAFPDLVASYITRIISEIFYRSDSSSFLSVTALTAMWSASRGTVSVYSGLNTMVGYTKTDNWFAARIVAFFYTIIFILIIVATIVILVFGNSLLQLVGNEFLPVSYAASIVFKLKYPIFFILFILGFAAIYTFLPQRRMKYRKQLVGAAAAAFGWIGFSYFFSLYVMHFSRYSVIYGSLAAIMLLMLWVYFCVYMLLIGAEINKHIESGYFKRLKNAFKKTSQK